MPPRNNERLCRLTQAEDTAGRQCISVPLTSLFLSLMLSHKGQPFPPERRNCSHTFRSVRQFRLPSAPQRYNTPDFPGESRVPTGMPLAPVGNPEPKGLRPLWTPLFSSSVYIQICSGLYISQLPKTQKSHRLHPMMGMKSAGFYVFCARTVHLKNNSIIFWETCPGDMNVVSIVGYSNSS